MKKATISVIFLILISHVGLWSQIAPVTTAGSVINATPGDMSVPVPITVTGFNNIRQFTLTLRFDTTRVRYVSGTPNTSLSGMTINYTPPSGNTQGKLVMAWTGASNVTLSDNSSIASLVFNYVTGTGILYWSYTFGNICQYKTYQGGNLVLLSDSPKYLFYLNGGISNRTAPFATAPVVPDPVAGPLNIPLTVNNFTTIAGLTLYLEYDPAVITYLNTFTKNPSFGSSFQVGDNEAPNGYRYIVIQWYGSSVTLPDGAVLCILNFNYLSPNCNPCNLTWFDNGASCEYTDDLGNVLIDMPQSTFYADGVVASGLHPTWTGAVSGNWNDPANWNSCGVPNLARNAIIPNVAPNLFPVINTSGSCKSLTVQSGATLTVGISGSVTVGDN
ncbi:MAG: hypothetical protein RBS55_06840 [Bacteroidales bacterium]|jgi:hypothetical protein|nr:hypothetical protein [Bacteroidales bacterium]